MNYFIVAALAICGSLRQASGHGRMMEPVARSSAWRLGFPTPRNYDDNALFCGGFAMGQVIRTKAEIIYNHFGYMEYRICPNNDVTREVTRECLDQHVLQRADGKGTRVVIDTRRTGEWTMEYKLPAGMTCSQCVVQWKYHAGNSWGVDPVTGRGCVGCGRQEEFYGCADVAIEGDGPLIPPKPAVTIMSQTLLQRVQSTTPREFTSVKTPCKGINNWAGDPHMDQWCTDSCSRGNCPSYGCDCTGTNPIIHQAETTTNTTTATTRRPTITSAITRATTPMHHQELTTRLASRTQCNAIGLWAGNEYLDRWCADACAHGNCPPDSCHCTVVQWTQCNAIGLWTGNKYLDRWCADACLHGNCPPDSCHCIIVLTEPTTTLFPETGTLPHPSAPAAKVCKAVALWKGIDVFDRWCTDECNNHDNCPPETCECTDASLQTQPTTTSTTQVTSAAARSGMTCSSNGIVGGDYWNGWCQSNCDRGYCPSDYCLCL